MGTLPSFEVYGLHAGDGVIRYVGQSTRGAAARFKGHISSSRGQSDYPVYRWMRRIGDEVTFTVLETCADLEELNAAEVRWTAELKTFIRDGHGGLNLTRGGGGIPGHVRTEQSRIRAYMNSHIRWHVNRELVSEYCYLCVDSPRVRGGRPPANSIHKPRPAEPLPLTPYSSYIHNRWHVRRNFSDPKCSLCGTDQLERSSDVDQP